MIGRIAGRIEYKTDDHVLTIQTADQQRFANLLLSIGVRMD